MKLVDYIAIGLVLLLALRAVMRARKLSKNACGSCEGCAQAQNCSKKPEDLNPPA